MSQKHVWDYSDYARFPDDGNRYEVIDGEVVEKATPTFEHGDAQGAIVATFRPVKVGIAGEEHFEVLEGVAPGDTIVAGPYQAIRDLKEGARVRGTVQASDTTRRGS